MGIRRFPSDAERELGHNIRGIRDDIGNGVRISPDDIEKLFLNGIENGTVNTHNYASFFVLLREACFNPQNPDFEKFDLDRTHGMLNVFLRHLAEFIDQCSGIQAGITLFCLAKMGYNSDAGVIRSLLDRAAEVIGELDLRGIANVLWAAAVFGETNHPAVQTLVEAVRDQLYEIDPEDPEDLYIIDQLYRFHFVSKTLPGVEKLFSRLPLPRGNDRLGTFRVSKEQRYLYDTVRTALPQTKVTISKFIREIHCELDIAVECGDLRFDIECDGPHHVFRRLADKLNDDMKREEGWKVFRIDTRDNMTDGVLDKSINPVISEIRRRVADIIPSIVTSTAPEYRAAPSGIQGTTGVDVSERSIREEIADFAFEQTQLVFDLCGGRPRVYAIAAHLGTKSDILARRMREEWGINVTNRMSVVSFGDAEKAIKRYYQERRTALKKINALKARIGFKVPLEPDWRPKS